VKGWSDEDVEVDPRSKPDPYPRAVLWTVVALLIENRLSLTEIAEETELSRQKVTKGSRLARSSVAAWA
jgi:hypothetical protein